MGLGPHIPNWAPCGTCGWAASRPPLMRLTYARNQNSGSHHLQTIGVCEEATDAGDVAVQCMGVTMAWGDEFVAVAVSFKLYMGCSPRLAKSSVDPVVIINNAIGIATQAYLTIRCNCNSDN